MSFCCQSCNVSQPDGEQPIRITTAKRKRTYPERSITTKQGYEIVIDNGGQGWEIVSEKEICSSCFLAMSEAGQV